MKVVGHWHVLPRRVVDAWTLAVLRAGLDKAWSDLVQWRCPCPGQRGSAPDDLLVHSNPLMFYESMM